MNPRIILVAFACLGMADVSFGQLFPNARWNRGGGVVQSQSGCPGGVCPVPSYQSTYSATSTVTSSGRGHWSYPGSSIANHLSDAQHAAQLAAMGISTVGMTQEQMLATHDALHEGRSVPRITPATRVVVPPAVVTVRPQPQPVVVAKPAPLPQETVSVTALGQRERGNFRRIFLNAARTARQSGDITDGQYYRLVAMSLRPATLDRIKDFIAASAVEDGLASMTAIDWDSLLNFIEKLIPIIIQLIDLFSYSTVDMPIDIQVAYSPPVGYSLAA